jgi:beta-fructofuranosidase
LTKMLLLVFFSSLFSSFFISSSFASSIGDHLCYDTTGNSCSCGPGCDQCSPHPFDQTTPQFHVRDLSCGENDPNFPFYDSKHNLYHLMYQDHLSEYQGGDGQGPDIGHAVSADMVTWAHLPVSVWNDQPYDSVAIYTGSATVVNGLPTLVYPGLCTKHNWSSCDTGTLLAIAIPADHENDPLLTNWTKPNYNPIVNNTQRDPSTAWQTAAGEWRLTNYEGKVYSSSDFITWSAASNGAVIFPVAECPDFFSLPAPCTGNGCSSSSSLVNEVTPTHVHKQSSNGQDWYTLGTYTEDSVGSTGTWTPLPSVPTLQALDYSAFGTGMHFYASKSFFDSKENRQIYWGWALVPPASTQTLPRVTNYHAGLKILTFNPLPELSSLRATPSLFSASTLSLSNETFWLGDWSNGAGNQSELGATFTFPTSGPSIEFGLSVLNGNVGKSINVSTQIVFTFDPSNFTLKASIGGSIPSTNLSYYMPGVDLPGGDYNVTNVNYSDPKICQAQCTADGPKCQAYTYVVRPPLVGSCCLKSIVPPPNPNPSCTSGSKVPTPLPSNQAVFDVMLVPGDTAVDVRVFTDNTFIEVFIMGGRHAVTYGINSGVESTTAGMTLFSSSSITVTDVNAWHLNSIWVSPQEILASRK